MWPPSRKSKVEEFGTVIKIIELQKKICLMIATSGTAWEKLKSLMIDLNSRNKKNELRSISFGFSGTTYTRSIFS